MHPSAWAIAAGGRAAGERSLRELVAAPSGALQAAKRRLDDVRANVIEADDRRTAELRSSKPPSQKTSTAREGASFQRYLQHMPAPRRNWPPAQTRPLDHRQLDPAAGIAQVVQDAIRQGKIHPTARARAYYLWG